MGNVAPAVGNMVKHRWSELLKATLLSVGSPARWISLGSSDDRRILVKSKGGSKGDPRSSATKKARVDAFGRFVRDNDPVVRTGFHEPNWRRDIRSWLDKRVAAQPDKIWRVLAAVRRNWCIGLAQVGYIQHATAVLDVILARPEQSAHAKSIASLLVYSMFPPLFAYDEVVPRENETKAQIETRVRSGLRTVDHRLTLNLLAAPDADPYDIGIGSLMAYELLVPRDLVAHRVEKSPLTEVLQTLDEARISLWDDALIPSRVDLAQIDAFELRAIARLVDLDELALLRSNDVYAWPQAAIKTACATLANAALVRLGFPDVYQPEVFEEAMRELREIA